MIIYGNRDQGLEARLSHNEEVVELWSHELSVTQTDTRPRDRFLCTIPKDKWLAIAKELEAKKK